MDYSCVHCADSKPIALVYQLNRDCVVGLTVKRKYYEVDAVRKAAERTVSWETI